jgi:uncharacterized protein (TIGR02284 family)
MDTDMSTHDDVVKVLNDLIETCFDGANGFRTAAEGVSEDRLKALFSDYSRQRQQLAAELQTEVTRLGGEPTESGSMAGAAHRGWINIKAAVTGKDDTAILAECERGEDVAVDEYEKALQSQMSEDTAQIVRRQYATVKAAHDRVRELEKSHEQAAH